jgi:outer membrane receptor for ferrienterochelin and colicins
MKKYLLAAVAISGFLLHARDAAAQSINYDDMNRMFGEPVTTSATGKPQRMSDAPVSMEILTQDDIRHSGAVNLAEALRQSNSLNVVQRGEQQYDVGIRGYNNDFSTRLLVLINGRQVYLDYFGFTNWTAMPIQMEEIQQIEIVKGPNTALFGFNAVSGVINIVTYNPLYNEKSSATATIGTSNYRKGSFTYTYKANEKLGIRLSADAQNRDSFDNPANGTQRIFLSGNTKTVFDDPKQDAASLDTVYQLTSDSQLRFEASRVNVAEGHVVSNGDAFREEQQMNSVKLGYEYDSRFGLIKANVYDNYMHLASLRQGVAGAFGITNTNLVVAQLEDTFKLNANHTFRVQAEFRDNAMKSNSFTPNGARVSYDVYATGAMWDWKIIDSLSWTNAGRVDHLVLGRTGPFTVANPNTNNDYDQEITEYSYNSGFVWKATQDDTIRLSTSRGVELPSLFEYGVDFVAGPVTLVGNPRLHPTVVTNYELAWDRSIHPLDGKFRSAVFFQKSHDVKSYRAQTVGATSITKNVGVSESGGVELSLDGTIDKRYDWGLAYIFQATDDDLANGKNGLAITVPREYEEGNPQHQANIKLGYHEGPWEANSLVYYVADIKALGNTGTVSRLDPVDAYVGVNARVAYNFDNGFTVALHGQQLQAPHIQTSSAPDVDRTIFLSFSKKFH